MLKLRTSDDPQAQDSWEEYLEHLRAYYSAMSDAEFEAELRDEQADMVEENPQRLGMTEEEGRANAGLLRREANDLRRDAMTGTLVMRTPVRVGRRPNVRRPRSRVRRMVRRRARAPGRSLDGPSPHELVATGMAA